MAQTGSAPETPDKAAFQADEMAVAANHKALLNADNAVRAAAAAELRRIVAKYPSGTIYLAVPMAERPPGKRRSTKSKRE
jgi:hypothetical protein